MFIKKLVSGSRRRMEIEGYNIDLTYVCDNRIIVMSYPASGGESIYRNNYRDVSRIIIYIGLRLFASSMRGIGITIGFSIVQRGHMKRKDSTIEYRITIGRIIMRPHFICSLV
jgi:hypothetical protein